MNKRSYSLLLLTISIFGIFILYYVGQAYFTRHSNHPQVSEGIIDLTQWDFNEDGAVKLSGTWQFYWDQLLEPGQVGQLSDFLKVPGQWNKQGFPQKGAATYRALLKVNPSQMMYGIRISNIQMASSVYINGVEMGRSGQPALQREAYTPENKGYAFYFPMEGDKIEIVIHVANFDFINSGVTYNIQFGSMKAIQSYDKLISGFDMVVIIALAMIGIHHLGMFLKRRQEKSLLYFGLYGVLAALAMSTLSDKLFIQWFADDLPFGPLYKIPLLAVHGSMIVMILCMRTICASVVPAWFFRTGIIIFSIGLVFTLGLPFHIYSYGTFLFSLAQMLIYCCLIWMMSVSKEERYGNLDRQAVIILICALYALLVGLFDQTAFVLGMVPNNILGNLGILFFTILISLLLSFRFADAYKTIAEMSEQLLETDRLKDEFLLNTSHEFQTPLNGILNISQSMLEGAAGQIEDKHKLNLTMIQESAQRLSALVGDILDLERIKRNDLRLELAAIDVKVTVSVILELFNYLVSAKELRLVNNIPDDLPPVLADPYRLRQILSNLIGNSIKFTEQGSIEITAEVTGKQIKVTVQDTGIGMLQGDWERVFQAFTQVDHGQSGGYGGVGLGLSISRQLIKLMRGDILIEESAPGDGTRIAFFLPIAEQAVLSNQTSNNLESFRQMLAKQELIDESETESNTASFTVLAVDDEPSNLQVLINLFASEQCRVLVATNGSEALRILQTNRDIDLVLLDVMMPKMSGYEVCRAIRSQFALFDLPVVLLTVRNSPQDIAAGFAAGANDFIVKPFNAWEVRARVKTLFELKRSVRNALKAEMAFLQSQIKPHFLFNALNAIMSICYTDSARAAQLINHLSSYLRRSFDIPSTDMYVSLRDEIKLVESYVEIEKARFDERLVMEYEIDESLLDIRIVPLIIQPLVENAIRHGIMKRKEGGKIRLKVSSAKSQQDALAEQGIVYVEVWDNGKGISGQKLDKLFEPAVEHARQGVGVSNIHRRLLGLFGEGLHIESVEGEWTNVQFQIKVSNAIDKR